MKRTMPRPGGMSPTLTSRHPKESEDLLAWWCDLTTRKVAAAGEDDPATREAVHKSRLLSVMVFFLLIIFLMLAPACPFLPNRFVLVADLSMLFICIIALLLNYFRSTLLAGAVLVLSFEAALVLVILTTMPLDEPSIQQYELFVFGELLAVSLLNSRSVFPVALFNCGFIIASLLYQPHTHALNLDLHVQFWPMLVCPIGVQLLVAGVTSLWVSSATGSTARAYKAEQAATAAQQVAERQRELSEQERKLLQESIERVVQNHANAMNQHTPTKIPLQEYEPVLWPLINVFNSLQNRLQRSQHMEKDLQQLDQAIARCTHHIYQGGITALQTLQTKTALDPLLVALREQQYRRPGSPGTIPGSPKGKGE